MILEFAYPRPPLSANQRLHWAQRSKLTREVRSAAEYKARAAEVGQRPRVAVTLTWFVPDRRRRDADNIYPTFKAMCDGLVDAGVVPDDTPEFMDKCAPRIVHEAGRPGRMELLIEGVKS